MAAVELLNILRPTVAVDRYITFAALALHQQPRWREALKEAGDPVVEAFTQEVRRFYPFFPAVAGRSTAPFEWRGRRFGKGTWVMVDVVGSNHDPDAWGAPGEFRPERFLEGEATPYNFAPQGGGDPNTSHRCPGEAFTVALMMRAVRLLTRTMDYRVPAQDLSIDLGRMPAVPGSRFVIDHVRSAGGM